MILGIFDWLNRVFTEFENLISDHADNPILWILIIVVLLFIVASAYNTLSK